MRLCAFGAKRDLRARASWNEKGGLMDRPFFVYFESIL
jgi:hypothetical protein